jgi:beta-galactosidase
MVLQWRKSRGSSEKFHGAVVDHVGHGNTRVFKEVASVGEKLKKVKEILGTRKVSKVGLYFDWENWWAFDNAQGYSNTNKNYHETCYRHYKALWELGINVDIIGPDSNLDQYDIIVAPMLYMTKESLAKDLETYVESGGTFIGTYISGIVNENDLVHRNGFPGPLRKLFGIWVEETDVKYEDEFNSFDYKNKTYPCSMYYDILHLETAESLAVYNTDFYKDTPVLTSNSFGDGKSYYIASQPSDDFLKDFYSGFDVIQVAMNENSCVRFDTGISITSRTDGKSVYHFIMNCTQTAKSVVLRQSYDNLLDEQSYKGHISLEGFGLLVLKD